MIQGYPGFWDLEERCERLSAIVNPVGRSTPLSRGLYS